MSFRKFFGLAVVCVLSCALSDSAQGIYIAQTAQGSDTGTDAADAHSVAWLNTSANWGIGTNQVGAGGIVHLCGIILNPITIQASGIAGNPITIYFESNCVMTAPYWPTGAINMTSKNNVIVNGGANGIITATNNGSALTYQTNSYGVVIYSSQTVTVENLNIFNMYQRTSDSDETGGYGGEKGIGVLAGPNGSSPNYCSNITVSNCTMHDVGEGASFAYDVIECSNYLFVSNTVYRCSLGAICGDREGGALLSGFTCSNNHVYDFSNWDDTIGDDFHHDAIYAFAYAANSVCSNVVFNANLVGPDFGLNSTAGAYLSGNCPGALLYNNAFVANNNDAPDDAFIYLELQQGSGSHYTPGNDGIYNNTFMGGGVGTGILIWAISGTNYVENNIFNAVPTAISYIYSPTNSLVSNYNFVNGLNPSMAFSYSPNSTAGFLSLAGWQSHGFDAHSINNNPLLNPSGMPQVGSPTIGAGTNLANFFTTDYAGNSRPTSGAWTTGAYQVTGSGSITVTNAPSAIVVTPAIENFGVVPIGTTTSEVLTVQNTGTGILTGGVTVTPPYNVVSGGSYTLTQGQSQAVTISFSPTTVGNNVQAVTFGGGNGTNVELTGGGMMPPPQSLQAH